MSRIFLSCTKSVKDPFEAQEGRWEESLIAGSGPGTKPGLTRVAGEAPGAALLPPLVGSGPVRQTQRLCVVGKGLGVGRPPRRG